MGMKKLAALVMALMLCLTAVSAMAVTVNSCDDLVKAIAEVGSNGTITFGKSFSGHGIVIPQNKNFTLDFANYTYTVDGTPLAGSEGTKTQAFQILKGSTITFKNGTIKVASPDIGVKMLVQNYSSVNMENMVLDGTNLTGGAVRYVFSNNCGNSSLTGSTSILTRNGDVAFDVCDDSNYTGGTTMTVNTTGTIDGDIEMSGTDPNLTINNVNHVGEFKILDSSADISITNGAFTDPRVQEIASSNGYTPETFVQIGDWDSTSGPRVSVFGNSEIVNELLKKQSIKSGEEIVVFMGGLEMNNVPSGTGVLNLGGGKVIINDVKVPMTSYDENTGTYNKYVVPAPYSAPVDLPQTGDNSSLMLWSAMLALAAAGFVVSRKTRLN